MPESHIKRRSFMFSENLISGLRSGWSYIGFLSLLTALILNTMTEWGLDPNTQDVLYFYQVAHVQPLSLVSLSLSGLGSFFYIKERENGFDNYCVIRAGRKKYSRNKSIVSILIGPLVVLIAEIVFIAVLASVMPICKTSNPVLDHRINSEPFGFLLKEGLYGVYLTVELFYRFISSLFVGAVSFAISVIIDDIYASIAGCFILYFILCGISASNRIPIMLNAYAVINGPIIYEAPFLSLLYSAVYVSLLVVAVVLVSTRIIRKGYE